MRARSSWPRSRPSAWRCGWRSRSRACSPTSSRRATWSPAAGSRDVISIVHTDAEITPPLYFVAAWLTTRIGVSPELLRAPSLLAGAAAIPLVYLLGVRTVGRRAALVAAALDDVLAVHGLLLRRGPRLRADDRARARLDARAADGGRGRAGPLVGRLRRLHVRRGVHALHERVRARGAARVGAVGASGRAPAGARRDGGRGRRLPALALRACGGTWTRRRPTSSRRCSRSRRLRAIEPHPLGDRLSRTPAGHRACATCPAIPALVALALGGRARRSPGSPAAALRGRLRRSTAALVLVIVLAASVPVGEALVSAVGSNLFGTRNLAASWPAFALCLAALLVAAGPRLGIAAAALAIGGVRGRRAQDARTATSGGPTTRRSPRSIDRERRRATSSSTARASARPACPRRSTSTVRGTPARLPPRARRGPLRPVPDPRARRRRRRT